MTSCPPRAPRAGHQVAGKRPSEEWALAIRAGAHPKPIAERLGHCSITTTLNTYGHLFPALDKELAGRLDDMARGSGVARLWNERPGETAARHQPKPGNHT